MLTAEPETDPTTDIEITPTSCGLKLSGELDATNCAALREAFAAFDGVEGVPLQVDMSQVSFMDSSGIGVLIAAFKARSGLVRIVDPSRPVARILQLTGLYERFVDQPDS